MRVPSLGWNRRRVAAVALMIAFVPPAYCAYVRWDYAPGRFFRDQTYHHQVLRALDHMAAQGADVSEVLYAVRGLRAGDADGWYDAWTALGDRNRARADATQDRQSRGQALLRAHTYYLRAEFFLDPHDPRRPASFARNTAAFYEGLDTLGIAYERIDVPYDGHTLHANYYPAPSPTRGPLIVFCGGFDSTLEELYFFLVSSARARGYDVLTFEGPGQGSVLREQGVPFTPAWERPTSAVLDTFLASHARPHSIVMIGLSLGGYLASRAAAFDDRIDALVAYDVFFDGAAVAARIVPRPAYALRALGLDGLVDVLASLRGQFDPSAAWSLANGRWTFDREHALDVAAAAAELTLRDVAGRIHQDVLIFAGEEDQFVPVEQAEQFRHSLTGARSVTVHVYDAPSGGAEHSQLGASTLWQSDLFDWLETHVARR